MPKGIQYRLQKGEKVKRPVDSWLRLPRRCKWDLYSSRCYAALVGCQLPTFRDNLSVPSSIVKQSMYCLSLGDGTDRLSRSLRS